MNFSSLCLSVFFFFFLLDKIKASLLLIKFQKKTIWSKIGTRYHTTVPNLFIIWEETLRKKWHYSSLFVNFVIKNVNSWRVSNFDSKKPLLSLPRAAVLHRQPKSVAFTHSHFPCLSPWVSVFYSLSECLSQSSARHINWLSFLGEPDGRCVKYCWASDCPKLSDCHSESASYVRSWKYDPRRAMASKSTNKILQTQLLKMYYASCISVC